jgi:hypothetical protein
MTTPNYISLTLLFVAAIWVSACDSVELEDTASPQIRIVFADHAQAARAAKMSTVWDVRLSVVSTGGVDYSPDPVRINDAVNDEAVFMVELPADSVYAFSVVYSRSGIETAVGAVTELVERSTSDITIPVVYRDGSIPSLTLLPSRVRIPRTPGTVQLDMMYFGRLEPVVGLASRLRVSGTSASALTVDGPDITLDSENIIEAAWRFTDAVVGAQRIGTLTAPTTSEGTICVSVNAGDTRTVAPNGTVSPIASNQACVEVLP